jgi:2,4-dienoyl-CoA reductase-like NADH-dependent reductase (Old Yellow Enzyme family)/thioredoxin reductase
LNNAKHFAKLLEPAIVAGLELKNRIVMPPMGTNMATIEGHATESIRHYYEERAKGGVGLIIVETTCIDAPAGKTTAYQMAIDDDRFVRDLARLAETIHQHGSKAVLQLQHGGRGTKSSITGFQPVSPSPVPMPYGTLVGYEGEMPRELAASEIKDLVSKFAKGAVRARKAGFDGVEIHATGYYLVAQFLSSTANVRRDEYGGTLRNRARFLVEIIQAIREAVGSKYPLLCKLSAFELGPGAGLTFDEGKEIAQIAEEAGVDALEVAGMLWGIIPRLRPTTAEPVGGLLPFVEGIKAVVNIPVIAGSRITPEAGERALQEGKADLIAIGKGLIADPYLPSKLALGRTGDIRPCIGCLRCIDNQTVKGLAIMCSVNATTAREAELEIRPAEKIRKVIVVGGGPAGMEAARVAALRGHKVLLIEKQEKLGGQLLEAVIPPHKDHLPPFIDYLETQLAKNRVEVRLASQVTAADVCEAHPDAVILANGIVPNIPNIPGLSDTNVLTAWDVLKGTAVGDTVVVIGGGLVGCETAEYLAMKGKKVTVLEMLEEVATAMPLSLRNLLVARLADRKVDIYTGVECRELTVSGVRFVNREKEEIAVRADSVVIAAGGRPDTGLREQLKGDTFTVRSAGDCVEPRGVAEAVDEGFRAGLAV